MPVANVKYIYKKPGSASQTTGGTGITVSQRSDDLVRVELQKRHKGLEVIIISITWK